MAAISQSIQLDMKIRLSRGARKQLAKQAAQAGRPLDDYASELLEHAASAANVDAVLAPLRKEFAASGTTDAQLVEQINEARGEYHAGRRRSKRR